MNDDNRLDFVWDFYNSDGSNVEMCGNGARCVAKYYYDEIRTLYPELTFANKFNIITVMR